MTDYSPQSSPTNRGATFLANNIIVYSSTGVQNKSTITTVAGDSSQVSSTLSSNSAASGNYMFSKPNTTAPRLGAAVLPEVPDGNPEHLYNKIGNSAASVAARETATANTFGAQLFSINSSLPSKNTETAPVPSTFTSQVPQYERLPTKYRWNLPPHKWSLPVLPSADKNFMPAGYKRSSSSDMYRRGRIWWDADADITLQSSDSGGLELAKQSALAKLREREYGFQFLWNPESFATSVAVQMDATPNVNDQWLGAGGFFPASEQISFTIRIDRTNDFACAAAAFKRPSNISQKYTQYVGGSSNESGFGSTTTPKNDFISQASLTQFVDYYKGNATGFIAQDGNSEIILKLQDLYQRGTLADIEFLYKAINGPGAGNGTVYTNPRGIATSAIGYLIPNRLNIDIGPLSYKGWATTMNVSHIAFTQDMIPIRSDVTISFNLLASYGVTSDNAGGR